MGKKYETCRKRKRMEEENTNRANIYVLDPRVRQKTLEQTLERTRKYPSDHPQQIEGETLMGHWLCDALLPYTTTENQQFVNMIAHFTKRFNVPSEKVMRERIIQGIHEKVQYSVKESLNKNVTGVYAITTDMWSSKDRHGYISYTAH